MANVSHIFGVRPMRYLDSSPWNGANVAMGFSASQANDCYIGDLVKIDTTNRITAITDPFIPGTNNLIPIVAAQSTAVFRGIVAGFYPAPDFSMAAAASLGTRYRVASTLRYGMIIDDYGVLFEAEEGNGNSYTSAATNSVNKLVDIKYAAGSTTTGISGVILDASTVATGGALPFRLYRMTQRVDNFNFVAGDTNSLTHYDLLIANSDLAQANTGA